VNGRGDVASVHVTDLRVELADGSPIVSSASFAIEPGRVLGLVGESGCGKTTTALAMLGYARSGARIARGTVEIGGVDIRQLDERALRRFRGRRVAYVPQDPALSLDPGMRVGRQVEEMLLHHGSATKDERLESVRVAFERVDLPATNEYLSRYPHELSGGQQQRIAIAMALICRPGLVVFDEPTTGLDVTTQARVLKTIAEVSQEDRLAMLYVTHDLGVVAHFADDVAVMYAGRIVEQAATEALFAAPRHPYTRMLIQAIPRSDVSGQRPRGIPGTAPAPGGRASGCAFAARCSSRIQRCQIEEPGLKAEDGNHLVACFNPDRTSRLVLVDPAAANGPSAAGQTRIEVDGLTAGYRRRRVAPMQALQNVSFALAAGQCLAIVGESGSGKTTLGRCLAGLHAPAAGRIVLDGRALAPVARKRSRDDRRQVQLVFQNPDASLNPRHSVADLIGRPIELFLRVSPRERLRLLHETLELVRLDRALAASRPSELSGGEKQRVAIARAIAPQPAVLICDEITSALDVSVQAAILDVLADLREASQLSIVFISHDLAVVRSIADEILVLQRGITQELSSADSIFARPAAAYTRELMRAQRDWSLTADVSALPECR
jgi:peptide/nickel transport system ATP-binding protein